MKRHLLSLCLLSLSLASTAQTAPDLVITSSLTPTTAMVGTILTASFTVTNAGNAEAAASNVVFYQSTDNVLTPGQNGDVALLTFPVATLAPGATTGSVTRIFPIPCTQAAGSYHAFLVADGGYVVAESNENNNIASNSLTVQALQVTVTPASASICAGASVSLTASGATTYSWSPGLGLNATSGATVTANPTSTTTYTVTGANNTCIVTKEVAVTVNPKVIPTVSISYTGCGGNALSFTAATTNGGSSPQVEWFVNNAAAGTGNTFTLNNTANGTQVYARLTSNAPCALSQTANSAVTTVNCTTTALPHIEGLEEVVVLPNPTQGMLAVRLKLQTAKAVAFRLMDVHGREVFRTAPQRLAGTATRTLDLRSSAAGVYYLQVQVGKETFTEKIVRLE